MEVWVTWPTCCDVNKYGGAGKSQAFRWKQMSDSAEADYHFLPSSSSHFPFSESRAAVIWSQVKVSDAPDPAGLVRRMGEDGRTHQNNAELQEALLTNPDKSDRFCLWTFGSRHVFWHSKNIFSFMNTKEIRTTDDFCCWQPLKMTNSELTPGSLLTSPWTINLICVFKCQKPQ